MSPQLAANFHLRLKNILQDNCQNVGHIFPLNLKMENKE